MDPLSIVGLVPLVASAIKLARNYWAGVRGAKEKAAALITELEALRSNLNELQVLLDSNGFGSEAVARNQSSVLLSCSTACRIKLEALVPKLERGLVRSKVQTVIWPFKEDEYKETISDLRSLTTWMQFSLSIGGYRLLSSSSSEVLEVLRNQLSHFEEIKQHQVELSQDLSKQRDVFQDSRRDRQDVLDWLSDLNVHAQHNKVQAARTHNTGSWFLQDETFLRWRRAGVSSRLLWCHGLPGSGKTVLSSLAVDDLLKESGPSCLVAFFYFNYREADRQDPRAVLSCLLRQVAAALKEVPTELLQMKMAKQETGHMSLEECKRMMSICLAGTERTYLILDGLDECDLLKHRKSLLETLHDLAQLSQVRLMVTSRSHIQDIARSFREIPQMKIVAHDEDLEEYMLTELGNSHGSDCLDEDLAKRIRREITKKANGMFLLAVLQLRSIINEPTAGEMEDALEKTSGDLTGAFEETISRIKALPQSRAHLGMGVLMWLCHAKRVMSTAEIKDALAFRKGRSSTLDKYRPSLNMILDCCHGLVILSADTEYIELAHYSVQEYLQSETTNLFPLFEQEMASTCLGYLMLEDFKHGPTAINMGYSLIKTRICDFPFVSYAARFWDEHIKQIQANESIWPLLLDFVHDNRAISSSIQIRRFEGKFHWMYVDPRECLSRTPIHNANDFGLETLLPTILEQQDLASFINTGTEIVGSTPIILAASSGHVRLVKLLLQHGADPFIANWYGNALHCAAEADQPESIEELVRFGMNPNDCDEYEGDSSPSPKSPVLCTLDCDSVSALKALTKLGASVNATQNCCEQPFLHEAADVGAHKIIEYLVTSGLADANSKSNTGQTALDCAIDSEDTQTIRTLLNVGADPRQINLESLETLGRLGLDLWQIWSTM